MKIPPKQIEMKTPEGRLFIQVSVEEADVDNADPIMTLALQTVGITQVVMLPIGGMHMIAQTILSFTHEPRHILMPPTVRRPQ